MATESQNRAKARKLTHKGVIDLWRKVKVGNNADWNDGKAFEYLILRAFELEKAEVQYPYSVRIGSSVVEQIDGVVHVNGLSAVVEAKDRSGKLNVEPISKLRSQLQRRPAATIGMVFSKNGFTDPALSLAQFLAPQTILLWEGGELELAINKSKLVRGLTLKYRFAVEHGLPDFNLMTPGVL